MNQLTKANIQSRSHIQESATAYENVDLSSEDYEPNNPFKGIQVGGEGDITIVGLNGATVTLTNVLAGDHSFAGIKIIRSTTTATGITALF